MTGDGGEAIKRTAAEFSAAVAAGEPVRLEGGGVVQHLSMLHELIAAHPIAACRAYAARPEIPSGRFASLDALRMLILQAPESRPGDVGDFPLQMTGENFIALTSPGSAAMLFVFTGAAHQFGGPIRIMHQWLRGLGVSIVYLFDMDWTYYLGGVRGLGDSVEAAAEALREIACRAGATSHLCMGNSGGGFGALLYATHLGARRTLALSPPTAIRESLEIVAQKVPRAREMAAGSDAIDLRALYEQSVAARQCRVYYPELNGHDCAEALNLAGLAGVELRPLAGVKSHNLIPHLVATMQFERELNWLVES